MTRMLFYELMQVALGHRDELSRIPSAGEWFAIFEESKKQAITGVMVSGLERLPKEQRPGKELLLQWIGISELIRQTNMNLTERCIELQKIFSEADVRTSILKGQGVAKYYPIGLRDLRQSGDIDVYVDCSFNEALSTANDVGFTVEGWDYKHAHLRVWKDSEIEMHYRVEVLLNLWKNIKLQRWFEKNKEQLFGERDGFVTPTVSFNLFYILLHIYRHFLYEGVGMRQLMDYYFILKSNTEDSTDNTDILNALQEFGMMRFAGGVMWIMQEIFGLEPKYMYCEPLESEGRFVHDEVIAGGNFGHHDQRLTHGGGKWNTVMQVCRHNWHLMSHYPADVVWAPVWFVWHKCWKLKTKVLLAV